MHQANDLAHRVMLNDLIPLVAVQRPFPEDNEQEVVEFSEK